MVAGFHQGWLFLDGYEAGRGAKDIRSSRKRVVVELVHEIRAE